MIRIQKIRLRKTIVENKRKNGGLRMKSHLLWASQNFHSLSTVPYEVFHRMVQHLPKELNKERCRENFVSSVPHRARVPEKMTFHPQPILSDFLGRMNLWTGRTLILSILFIFFTGAIGSSAQAQSELYSFPNITDIKTQKNKKKKVAAPFVQALAKKMGVPEEVLTETIAKGFGRTELIRLILVSQKSKKNLEELIQEREKGTRLAKISKSANLNNRAIRKEANEILDELEKEEEKTEHRVTGHFLWTGARVC